MKKRYEEIFTKIEDQLEIDDLDFNELRLNTVLANVINKEITEKFTCIPTKLENYEFKNNSNI